MANEIRTITVFEIAELIGKKEESFEVNGSTRTGIVWKPEDLPAVQAVLKPESAKGGTVLVDGMGPQWLIVAIVHSLHPCSVILTDPKVADGQVSISNWRNPGDPKGDLEFTVTTENTAVLVAYASETPIAAERLGQLVPPQTEIGKAVALTGRTATWAVAQIATAYAHKAPAVFMFQPGLGYVCAITHNETYVLGEVYPEVTDIPALQTVSAFEENLDSFAGDAALILQLIESADKWAPEALLWSDETVAAYKRLKEGITRIISA